MHNYLGLKMSQKIFSILLWVELVMNYIYWIELVMNYIYKTKKLIMTLKG